MNGGVSEGLLSTVSRRTRSQWDAFYRKCYDEININNNNNNNNNNNDRNFTKNEGSNSHVKKSCSSSSDSDDSENSIDKSNINVEERKRAGERRQAVIHNMMRPTKKKTKKQEELDLIKNMLLVESTTRNMAVLDSAVRNKINNNNNNNNALFMTGHYDELAGCDHLPLKFKFEDFEQESRRLSLAEKTDYQKEVDSLFRDLEVALWDQSHDEIGCTNLSLSDDEYECTISREIDESPSARCGRGEHETVVDEQIGIVCRYCRHVLLDIKHILPPFYVEPHPERRREWKYDHKESDNSIRNITEIQFEGSAAACGNLASSSSCTVHFHQGNTVLDLISDADKQLLYPHQLEGFEFMWRNIAGDIQINKLDTLPYKGGRGCIISHAPGTGKTRLTIVFLQTFMKLYPTCRPVIIAPLGMLLTWEREFKKWNVHIKFQNMNKTKLSGTGTADDHDKNISTNTDYSSRLVKLHSWMMGGSILGISYRLFEQLVGGNNKTFKKILVELPGLLVLDEGHNPRNKQSRTWKALTKVKTRRRVMLSGTPFQNNFLELYNTLCLVNPGFSDQIIPTGHDDYSRNSVRKRKLGENEWASLTSSISKSNSGDIIQLKKLQSMIEPFVHVYRGGILEKNLPGMRDYLVILKPTDLQHELLRNIPRSNKFLERAHLASLISVHPALVAKKPEFSHHKSEMELVKLDPNAGVKTRFLVNLIQLSVRLDEKILVFSQFIIPLLRIEKLLKRHFSWKQGREVVYMSGVMGINERQRLMDVFNDRCSEAKVMLASQKACSEGINLVGASRVVLLDVVWNPSVERQAICRAYRLGQEKVVHVYRLLTWAEVNKYARQAEKERLSELIFSRGDGVKMTTKTNEEKDKVLEAMVGHQSLGSMFERIVHRPKERSDISSDTF